MSQVVGNEPLCGLLSGIVFLMLIKGFFGASEPSAWTYWLTGTFLGLAVLTKPTAFLLAPPLAVLVVQFAMKRDGATWKSASYAIKRIGWVLGVACVISGWYFIRNWLEIGRFFIGGWDPAGYLVWWQDPSYRTITHLTTFGNSLVFPIYSSVAGFWDSVYSTLWLDGSLSGIWDYDSRPPWNYNFMISLAWLSLMPTAAILIGALRGVGRLLSRRLTAVGFAAGVLVLYTLAMLWLYISLPVYCVAKATYTLGLIPCYALLCADGFETLLSRPALRFIIWPLAACWAVACYAAFFVVR